MAFQTPPPKNTQPRQAGLRIQEFHKTLARRLRKFGKVQTQQSRVIGFNEVPVRIDTTTWGKTALLRVLIRDKAGNRYFREGSKQGLDLGSVVESVVEIAGRKSLLEARERRMSLLTSALCRTVERMLDGHPMAVPLGSPQLTLTGEVDPGDEKATYSLSFRYLTGHQARSLIETARFRGIGKKV